MKAKDLGENIGRPVRVVYVDPTFNSKREMLKGIITGTDEEGDRILALVLMANGRVAKTDAEYVELLDAVPSKVPAR